MSDYPSHLARERRLADGRSVLIRPFRPGDEALVRSDHAIDYSRHMSFLCEVKTAQGSFLAGEARYDPDPGRRSCELAMLVRDGWQESGIGELLLNALSRAAQTRGFDTMKGWVPRENRAMLNFAFEAGFEVDPSSAPAESVRIAKKL